MDKSKTVKKNWVRLFIFFSLFFLNLPCFAQVLEELEFNLEFSSPVTGLPKIYKPSIDLSGRGSHRDVTIPQTMAAKDALDSWQADMGFSNFYRLQYNLWEIQQLTNDAAAQEKLLGNYEEIIKKISDSGGTIILSLFGTPDGLGRIRDSNSAPHNLKAYKELVKNIIRKLSCQKKYNIWYEVWSGPDLEDFFLGEKSEYFNLYRQIGEAVKELSQENKMKIPLGGPSVSAWFKNIQPNNILSPEGSLIYELIKYCYNYRLPLDFISWHAYSSDPLEEKQDTIYKKHFVKLIRDWLTYFHFDSRIPLVIDEWNFDGSANISPKRGKDAYICASYIPARLKNMYEAQIDYQTYFCLEDFGGNKLGATRNLGAFSFEAAHPESKSQAKAGYNVFRMLNLLGQDLYSVKFSDEFVGIIPTKSEDSLTLLIYNYIDSQGAMNYLSRNLVYLNSADRKAVLNIVKSDRMQKIIAGQIDLATLRLSVKAKALFARAIELNKLVNKFSASNRKLKISLKGLKDMYTLTRYIVDDKCSQDCEFKPNDEKDVDFNQDYVEGVELSPYSVQLWIFKKKPAPPVIVQESVGQTEELVEQAKPDESALGIKPVDKATSKEEKNAENN